MQRDEVEFVPLAVIRTRASFVALARLNDVPVKNVDMIHHSKPVMFPTRMRSAAADRDATYMTRHL